MRLLIPLLLMLQASTGNVSDVALRDALTARYAKKLLTVRNSPAGTRLRFDADGKILESSPGVFTLDGSLRVESVNVSEDRVELRGRQAFLQFNTKTRKLEESLSGQRMTLEFGRTAGVPVERGIDAALVSEADLPKIAPPLWAKVLTNRGVLTPVVDAVTGVAVPRASESQGLLPRTLTKDQPNYPLAVRPLGITGSVVLRVIVDEQGKPHVADLVEPLGYGLDEAAMAAVQQWEFEPAAQNGKPVKVYIRVRVNFSPPR